LVNQFFFVKSKPNKEMKLTELDASLFVEPIQILMRFERVFYRILRVIRILSESRLLNRIMIRLPSKKLIIE
jgi:hypothetical protein